MLYSLDCFFKDIIEWDKKKNIEHPAFYPSYLAKMFGFFGDLSYDTFTSKSERLNGLCKLASYCVLDRIELWRVYKQSFSLASQSLEYTPKEPKPLIPASKWAHLIMLLAHYAELMNDESLDFSKIDKALADILVYMSEICSIIGYDFCAEFEHYAKAEFSTAGDIASIVETDCF